MVRTLLILLSLAAADQPLTLTGWVSDASCGARHTKPGGEDCVRKCIAGAVHLNPDWKPQKMVFVTDGDQRTWIVENPEALQGHEGRHVEITGRVDAAKNSVRVTRAARLDR